MEGLQRDAHKLRDHIIGTLLRLRHHCAGPYPRKVRLSDGSQLGLVVDEAEHCSFAGPAWLAVRRYLVSYLHLLLQEVAPDVVDL